MHGRWRPREIHIYTSFVCYFPNTCPSLFYLLSVSKLIVLYFDKYLGLEAKKFILWNIKTTSPCLYIKHVHAFLLEEEGEHISTRLFCSLSNTCPSLFSLLSIYKLIVVYLENYLELQAENYMVWNLITSSLFLYIKHVHECLLEAEGETYFHSFCFLLL